MMSANSTTTHESTRGGYLISTDRTRLDLKIIHTYLSQHSYWAHGRTMETVEKSVQNSLCFGIFHDNKQVAFARLVTDYATFAWLCDVFVLPEHRNQGLSKWLVEAIVEYPDLKNIKRILLATKDAHELYRKYANFEPLPHPERWMILPGSTP